MSYRYHKDDARRGTSPASSTESSSSSSSTSSSSTSSSDSRSRSPTDDRYKKRRSYTRSRSRSNSRSPESRNKERKRDEKRKREHDDGSNSSRDRNSQLLYKDHHKSDSRDSIEPSSTGSRSAMDLNSIRSEKSSDSSNHATAGNGGQVEPGEIEGFNPSAKISINVFEGKVPEPPSPPKISKAKIQFGKPGSVAKPGIQMKLLPPKAKVEPKKKITVASAFNNDSDEEIEEMPAECRMRMRNIGRDTPTSSGPNSFGKTKKGFVDTHKVFERSLRDACADVD